MNKNLFIGLAALLLATGIFCGCTETTDDNNNGQPPQIAVFLNHEMNIIGEPPNEIREITGQVENIAGRDIDKISVVALYYDKDNKLLFTGMYTIYQFIEGMIGNFYIDYFSTDPGYSEYDHYKLGLRLD